MLNLGLVGFFLTAGLVIGCQENPSSVSDKPETIKTSTSTTGTGTPSNPATIEVKDSLWCGTPSPTSGDPLTGVTPANPGTASDICSGPGPITLWGATPRCTNQEAPEGVGAQRGRTTCKADLANPTRVRINPSSKDTGLPCHHHLGWAGGYLGRFGFDRLVPSQGPVQRGKGQRKTISLTRKDYFLGGFHNRRNRLL